MGRFWIEFLIFCAPKWAKINYILDLDSPDSIAFGYSIQFRFLIHVQQAIIIANHLWSEVKQNNYNVHSNCCYRYLNTYITWMCHVCSTQIQILLQFIYESTSNISVDRNRNTKKRNETKRNDQKRRKKNEERKVEEKHKQRTPFYAWIKTKLDTLTHTNTECMHKMNWKPVLCCRDKR